MLANNQGRHPVRLSSRSSYPTFLSVQETALLQLTWAWKGLADSFKWNVVLSTVTSDAEIRGNLYKSLLLNSLSLCSIYVFDLLLQPLVRDQQKWFHRNLGWFYQILWLAPVVGVSLYLNATWCTTIANRTYLLQHGGRPVAPQATSYTGLLKSAATSAYRVIMVVTSLAVSLAVGRIPYFGNALAFVFFCWVDAYYCFEFVWISQGFSLSRRIRHLEERWAYFFAFGIFATAICMSGSTLANAALFALIYPAYIIMAIHAQPAPVDPYNPLPHSHPSSKDPGSQAHNAIRHPSPFIPIRIPVFALVIWLNDGIVRLLNAIGGRPVSRHTHDNSFSLGSTPLSPVGKMESAEEGGGIGGYAAFATVGSRVAAVPPHSSSTTHASKSPSGASSRPAAGRVNIGARRKLD